MAEGVLVHVFLVIDKEYRWERKVGECCPVVIDRE